MTTRRVLIADDHPPTRAGVRVALEEGGFAVCGEAADAEAAIAMAIAERPDICLLDISMPGDGIAAAARICELLPDTSVVMLTVVEDEEHLFDALRAGAIGYLLKDIDSEDLPRALRGVLNGEAALPRALVRRVIDQFRLQGRRRLLVGERATSLTSREWEVLELLRAGASTAEIGKRLFISSATVRTHVANVLHKLHVPDRASAVQLLEET